MDGRYDTIDIHTAEEWRHHVRFTSGSRWMVVYFSAPLDDPEVMVQFRALATRFPDLTFARVAHTDLAALEGAVAEAGVPASLDASRFEIVIGGKALSSQPNAKGTVIQPEHLFDGRLETILSTLVNRNYVVRKPPIHINPDQLAPACPSADGAASAGGPGTAAALPMVVPRP